eukprot:9283308-Lingulodinium_polyedra.AAC.1
MDAVPGVDAGGIAPEFGIGADAAAVLLGPNPPDVQRKVLCAAYVPASPNVTDAGKRGGVKSQPPEHGLQRSEMLLRYHPVEWDEDVAPNAHAA